MKGILYVLSDLIKLFPPQTNIVVTLLFIVVALILIFAGRAAIKALIFIVAGLAGATIASFLASFFLEDICLVIVIILGFIIFGLIGIFLLRLGIGLALGILGYFVLQTIISNTPLSLIGGIILFVAGAILYNKILSLISVLIGSLLLFETIIHLGLQIQLAALIVIVLAVIGLIVQNRYKKLKS